MGNNSDHADLGAAELRSADIFSGGLMLDNELFQVSTCNQDPANVFIICQGAGNTQCIFSARSALQQVELSFILVLRSVSCC